MMATPTNQDLLFSQAEIETLKEAYKALTFPCSLDREETSKLIAGIRDVLYKLIGEHGFKTWLSDYLMAAHLNRKS